LQGLAATVHERQHHFHSPHALPYFTDGETPFPLRRPIPGPQESTDFPLEDDISNDHASLSGYASSQHPLSSTSSSSSFSSSSSNHASQRNRGKSSRNKPKNINELIHSEDSSEGSSSSDSRKNDAKEEKDDKNQKNKNERHEHQHGMMQSDSPDKLFSSSPSPSFEQEEERVLNSIESTSQVSSSYDQSEPIASPAALRHNNEEDLLTRHTLDSYSSSDEDSKDEDYKDSRDEDYKVPMASTSSETVVPVDNMLKSPVSLREKRNKNKKSILLPQSSHERNNVSEITTSKNNMSRKSDGSKDNFFSSSKFFSKIFVPSRS
jgi:hypothetical protein